MNKLGNNFRTVTSEVDDKNFTNKQKSQDSQKRSA